MVATQAKEVHIMAGLTFFWNGKLVGMDEATYDNITENPRLSSEMSSNLK